MNNQEAKLILQAYRPGGQDASDPLFKEALEQVQREVELQKWFAEERAMDSRVQGKLRDAIAVPSDLKGNLLALRKIVRPARWWRKPAWLAAAAALIVLLATLAITWSKPRHEPQYAEFREAMVRNSLQESNHVKFESMDIVNARNWLRKQAVNTDFILPASLRNSPLHGCKVIDWNGHKVTLLCFMPDKNTHVDLFVIDCTHFRDFMPKEAAQFARSNGLTLAAWCKGDKTYLLAGTLDESALRNIL